MCIVCSHYRLEGNNFYRNKKKALFHKLITCNIRGHQWLINIENKEKMNLHGFNVCDRCKKFKKSGK